MQNMALLLGAGHSALQAKTTTHKISSFSRTYIGEGFPLGTGRRSNTKRKTEGGLLTALGAVQISCVDSLSGAQQHTRLFPAEDYGRPQQWRPTRNVLRPLPGYVPQRETQAMQSLGRTLRDCSANEHPATLWSK